MVSESKAIFQLGQYGQIINQTRSASKNSELAEYIVSTCEISGYTIKPLSGGITGFQRFAIHDKNNKIIEIMAVHDSLAALIKIRLEK